MDKKEKVTKDRIGVWLYLSYIAMLIASIFVIVKIVSIMFNLGLDPRTVAVLTPKSTLRIEQAQRGNIYDCNGRLLAITYPRYQIHIDCTVQKGKNSESQEQKWHEAAKEFAKGIVKYFPEKTADEYYKMIADGRKNGRTYLKIGTPVNNNIYKEIKTLPLASWDSYRGGVRAETVFQRYYPYDRLASRTIGFVRNGQTKTGNDFVGLDGYWDKELKGVDGRRYVRETDFGMVANSDSVESKAIKGKDLYSTINIDYQAIADQALRKQIDTITDLQEACLILMDVETGAIRSMVNLSRAIYGKFDEVNNISIGRKNEPGSVFKTVTLMSVLNDGYIKSLEETLPATNGRVVGTSIRDDHIPDFVRQHKTNKISVIDGFKISSNYVFATLAVKYYGNTPANTDRFLQNIANYNLADTISFDIKGLLKPTVPNRKSRYWSNTDLGSVAFGYSTEMTPLHIVTYYNAIANKGKMMKPYLVEKIEGRNDLGSKVLRDSICSKAVADTITRALRAVAEEGTGRGVRNAKLAVAGKTGTSYGTFPNGKYTDASGRRKYQGTFVGFFPADNPKYTILCEVFSNPTRKQFQGGSIPAKVVKEVVDKLYYIDPYFREHIKDERKEL